MSDFTQAIPTVLANEGGFTKNPNDPGNWTGGAVGSGTLKGTNFGLSAASYPDTDIEHMTVDEATTIYQRDFWIFGGLTSQAIATKLFDAYVNSKHNAVRAAQLALGYLQVGPIVADGNYGPQTEGSLNAVDEQKFLDEFKARLCKMYSDDAVSTPSEAGDLLGWLRRAVKG